VARILSDGRGLRYGSDHPGRYSDGDSITWGGELRFIQHIPGADGQPHVIIEDAGHFLQEDKGEEIAALWKAKSSPHPQGLSSLTIGRPGTLFKLKAKARDMDGLAITGLSAIEITLAIGDDVWSGPVPPCVLSGSGNTLNCR